MTTPFHARYFAHELTRHHRGAGVGTALFDACVEVNPHQIEAAVFALRNPLSAGVLLADEVGLGKTIEAGLVLCQYWAEKRRRLLVICPASLRKQWSLELKEKFNLPSKVVDGKSLAALDSPRQILIMSYHFAGARAELLRTVPFDLVVFDEAHKLRNVYKPNSSMSRKLRSALAGRRKVMLTATPLQNSVMELFGLTSMLSEDIFGDESSFKARYATGRNPDLEGLQSRLKPFSKRTLRQDVVEYIPYTKRHPMTFRFRSTDEEHRLYEAMSNYLMRDDALALPEKGRGLIEIVIRKLLASSSPAVAQTLERMAARLQRVRKMHEERRASNALGTADRDSSTSLFDGEDIDDEIDELLGEITSGGDNDFDDNDIDLQKLNDEIEELTRYGQWARSISVDTKSRQLLEALRAGFEQSERNGAQRKALIFTESRRTQDYLKNFLEANGYAGQITLFSGSNADPDSKRTIDHWIAANQDTGRASGSRVVDSRTALVEDFRDRSTIMLATEAAAEGINLQFCSLVVNYDLPWNPQRVEQRIGRCHRYGQKHDVVVINFLNERNHADVRVHELLTEKFKLFDGLFGTSDEVLGSIESGIDFEKRILEIYRHCRTEKEIDSAFAKLQEELRPQIERGLAGARRSLLDHFDEDVHTRLKTRMDDAKESLDRISRMFWTLSRFILRERAEFNDERRTFDLHSPPESLDAEQLEPHDGSHRIRPGHYQLISKQKGNEPGDFLYRLSHPLGEWVLETGRRYDAPTSEVRFDLSGYGRRLAMVEALNGQSGWMTCQWLVIDSFDREEIVLLSGVSDEGKSLDKETCQKMFHCDGTVIGPVSMTPAVVERLKGEAQQCAEAAEHESLESGNRLFSEEVDRIEKWAQDVEDAEEQKLKETKKLINQTRKAMRTASTTEELLEFQEEMSRLEKLKRRQRRERDDVEDQTAEQRELLIDRLKQRMARNRSLSTLFTIRWTVD
jgi:superfamily II DNA or RNA helicase